MGFLKKKGKGCPIELVIDFIRSNIFKYLDLRVSPPENHAKYQKSSKRVAVIYD
jgi:hypothetical protein